jgi:hypothetical protein
MNSPMSDRDATKFEYPEIDPAIFKIFLRLLYLEEIPKDYDEMKKALEIADFFGASSVCKDCARKLSENITLEYFITIFALGMRYDEETVKFRCRLFFTKEYSKILKQDQFYSLDPEGLKFLLTSI